MSAAKLYNELPPYALIIIIIIYIKCLKHLIQIKFSLKKKEKKKEHNSSISYTDPGWSLNICYVHI